MTISPIPILGGKSIYCINEEQMTEATRIAENDPASSPKVQKYLTELDVSLSRNEQAALAFKIIERLKASSSH